MSNSIVLDLNSVYDHTTNSHESFDGNYLEGNSDDDYRYSSDGRDNLEGGSSHDYLEGNSDDDYRYGSDGRDNYHESFDDNYLKGNSGYDYRYSSDGRDNLHGGSGDDYLEGNSDDDYRYGSDGRDKLEGGSSHDYLTGLKDKLTTPIIRFQNTDKPGTYLFVGEQEAASIRQNYKGFKEEGIAFQVAVSKDDPLMQPFYRFKNTEKGREGTYLFAGEQEAASIRSKYKNFVEEGLAFNSYSAGAGGGTADFVRFQNKNLLGTYLFAGSSEASLIKNNPDFTSEGLAFAAKG
jgi:Ca2+-binding RTX toxin-like protein